MGRRSRHRARSATKGKGARDSNNGVRQTWSRGPQGLRIALRRVRSCYRQPLYLRLSLARQSQGPSPRRGDRPRQRSPCTLALMFDEFGSVTPGIYPSTTFQRDADYELADEFVYGRYANPNGRMVEEFAAQLDGGAHALSFPRACRRWLPSLKQLPPVDGSRPSG